ncbi:carbohydrate ABC transporter permease [Evansella cellulosilytica]|uniref:Binding-protein-dependent transport systems inner membrane component n=1 Tax=Evansella cellulosilytica (strain ATCC 21833 / DSM 2522 / FERM P-1141 / JCM 9156 / N-4) TaxID=649639 RepID=E6TQN1_EVAC2|nr:sugar ABC transporter permease [Evansella cellulosilytica]ADU30542.1 binding-protein-dependent transport systems inner membrane component [Evansella cellulosilytica DSM 2522]
MADFTMQTDPKKPKRKLKKNYSQKATDRRSGYLFVSPFFILFGIFGVFPILFTAFLSFHRWDILGTREFVGFRNYSLLFTDDPLFWKSIGNTFSIWFLSTVPQLIAALIIAFLLNQAFLKGKAIFRLGIFMPNVTSVVAVAIVFSAMFGTHYGIINYVLSLFGVDPIHWRGSYFGTHFAISVMVMWRWVGYNAILYLAGLQSISKEIYEAATIDGANKLQQLFYITVPMLKPIIIFTVLQSTIGGMQLFAEPLLFGEGGNYQGLTVALYLYQEAFNRFAFGYAAAIAWMLFFIIILFSLFNLYLTKKIEST